MNLKLDNIIAFRDVVKDGIKKGVFVEDEFEDVLKRIEEILKDIKDIDRIEDPVIKGILENNFIRLLIDFLDDMSLVNYILNRDSNKQTKTSNIN